MNNIVVKERKIKPPPSHRDLEIYKKNCTPLTIKKKKVGEEDEAANFKATWSLTFRKLEEKVMPKL